MGEIRIVRPGKTRGYPYPVCKKACFCTAVLIKVDDGLHATSSIFH